MEMHLHGDSLELLQTHLYRVADVLSGRRFGDLVSQDPKGRKRVNINRLNQVVPT